MMMFFVTQINLKNISNKEDFATTVLKETINFIHLHKITNKLNFNPKCEDKSINITLFVDHPKSIEVELFCSIHEDIIYPFEKVMLYYNYYNKYNYINIMVIINEKFFI
jgi:hypothetical protein